MKKLIKLLVMASGVLPFASGLTYASASNSVGQPSVGATITARGASKDGNGIVYGNGNHDIGYKVWIATDTNPHQITDELGNVAVNGLIDKICLSSGTVAEWATVYDTNTISGISVGAIGTNALIQVVPATNHLAALQSCQTYEAQFNIGAVVLQTGVTGGGNVIVYWRPGRGGSQ